MALEKRFYLLVLILYEYDVLFFQCQGDVKLLNQKQYQKNCLQK